MDKLGNILPRVLRKQPGGTRLLGTQVASAFRVLIGPEVARLCDEVELRSGTLLITTSSPALAHQPSKHDFNAPTLCDILLFGSGPSICPVSCCVEMAEFRFVTNDEYFVSPEPAQAEKLEKPRERFCSKHVLAIDLALQSLAPRKRRS